MGALGAFLLFCVPIGGGIPAGVLMARNAGVSPPAMAVLYFLSDIVLAFTFEPILRVFTWLGRWMPPLARMGTWIRSLAPARGRRASGRARSARTRPGGVRRRPDDRPRRGRRGGHGFVRGWAIAITGDMLYFVVLMASTLWLQGVLGDERLTIGAVLLIMLVLPSLIRRLTGEPSPRRQATRR